MDLDIFVKSILSFLVWIYTTMALVEGKNNSVFRVLDDLVVIIQLMSVDHVPEDLVSTTYNVIVTRSCDDHYIIC